MNLNYIWISFFIISFVVGVLKLIFFGDTSIFKDMVDGLFDTTKVAVMDIALPLAGIMTFWLGIMKIGENAGAIRFLSRIVYPFFSKLFPSIPKNHPSIGNMILNFSANLLGLDNAATPLGLKAMDSLQSLNDKKDTASDSQIMFLVLHTSGLTLIPTSIMLYRYLNGAQDSTDIFIPCIIATFCTTLIGIILVGIKQKINLINPSIIFTILSIIIIIMGASFFIKNSSKTKEEQADIYIKTHTSVELLEGKNISTKDFISLYPISFQPKIELSNAGTVSIEDIKKTNAEFVSFEGGTYSRVISNLLLLLIPLVFIIGGIIKKINVFDSFIEGAKEGFGISVKIIPYLIAMLAAISLLRVSGVMDYVLQSISFCFTKMGLNTDFVPALPTALMKPLSGSGSRALMIEAMQVYGVDSFVGRLACIFQGSADTTFYIVALYFGSVGIKKIRYSLSYGLLTEFLGAIVAIFIAYYFF